MRKIDSARTVQFVEAAYAADGTQRVMFRIRSALKGVAENSSWLVCSPKDAETFARTLLEAAERAREALQ
ncbi:MAG: hypothetical protein J0I01_05800 [Stenotrophomonas nitritireducens]|uniref:hypothetical protein n=1 Tax=Stenotrophomonas nitritireducens TaxID=83617 RepID=UPI001ACAB2F4|nr:hypothetical protein [Stenotrophomonas nitritireducens]MBN8791726.1 hypothetical protein [Stenotrophomonas nitritireducens]MBN8795664.1 hypothetical protein [Stenotrophomonas nitritireducens]